MKVCEKVQRKGVTTYNEVADELVTEFSSGDNHISPNDAVSLFLWLGIDPELSLSAEEAQLFKLIKELLIHIHIKRIVLHFLCFPFSACVWPEEHSAACVRCTQCADGHEHHLQREKRDQMDWPAHKLCSGVPEPGGGEAKTFGENQTKTVATSRTHLTGEKLLFCLIRIILMMNLFWKWMCSIAANCFQEPCTEEPPERTTDEKAPTCQLGHSLAIYHRKHQQENSHWLQHLQWQVWYQKPDHLGFWWRDSNIRDPYCTPFSHYLWSGLSTSSTSIACSRFMMTLRCWSAWAWLVVWRWASALLRTWRLPEAWCPKHWSPMSQVSSSWSPHQSINMKFCDCKGHVFDLMGIFCVQKWHRGLSVMSIWQGLRLLTEAAIMLGGEFLLCIFQLFINKMNGVGNKSS